jgi:exopolysaccharide biosynthesis polyprenyl glycosylphosphotransferase
MKSMGLTRNRQRQLLLLGGDAIIFAFAGAGALTYAALVHSFHAHEVARSIGLLRLLVIAATYMLVFYIANLYDLKVRRHRRMLPFLIIAVVIASLSGAVVLRLAVKSTPTVRSVLLLCHGLLLGLGAYAWRSAFYRWVYPASGRRRVAVIEGGNAGESDFARSLLRDAAEDYEVLPGDVTLEDARPRYAEAAAAGGRAPEIFLFPALRDTPKPMLQSAFQLRCSGAPVYDLATFCGAVYGKIPMQTVDESWALNYLSGSPSRTELKVRRVFDFVGASILLLLAAPVMVLVALAVRLTSQGPALFIQERLGLHERPFRCLKFRTMMTDAESQTGPKWAEKDDPRVTSVGKVLRKTRLDELPQLFNVLRGEMSLVGFRPIRRHFADLVARQVPLYQLRFSIKPGLTGWPQVRYDYSGSIAGQIEKFEYELYYLLHRSLFLDMYILVKTVQVMIFGRGQ